MILYRAAASRTTPMMSFINLLRSGVRSSSQKCLPVFRFVGPGPRPTLFRLFHVAGGQQIKAPFGLIHELVGESLEPLVVIQQIVESVLKEFFTYDFVALRSFEFFT